MRKDYDPRTKLLIVLCTSTLIIALSDIRALFLVFILQLGYALFFKAKVYETFYKLRKVFMIFLVLIIIQSFFDNQGNVLLSILDITILTDQGVFKGISYLIRLFVIILSGTIIITSPQKELIQGLVSLKVPYDLALMSSIGIRFLPLLIEQMKDTLIAIQLRGIEVEKLKLINKLKVYAYIFTPVIVSTLKKAKYLALSIEMRAFRLFESRTNLIQLKFDSQDYILVLMNLLILSGIIFIV